MLWHIQIEPAPGQADRLGERLALEAAESGLPGPWSIRASRGFLDRGRAIPERARSGRPDVLVDPVVETSYDPGRAGWVRRPGTVVHVMPKPGVTDPEAESALALLRRPRLSRSPTSARSGPTGSTGRPTACPA